MELCPILGNQDNKTCPLMMMIVMRVTKKMLMVVMTIRLVIIIMMMMVMMMRIFLTMNYCTVVKRDIKITSSTNLRRVLFNLTLNIEKFAGSKSKLKRIFE